MDMWSYKPCQHELIWTEPYHAVLGAYIHLPELTTLWRTNSKNRADLYQFSAKSDKYNTGFCADRSLRLIDFRYAMLIVSDIRGILFNIHEPFTPEKIVQVCMHMKELSYVGYMMDGIIICAKNGNHIVLFNMDDIHESNKLQGDELTSLIVTKCIMGRPRLFVMDTPIDCVVSECIIEECIGTIGTDTYELAEWQLETMGQRQPNMHLQNPDLEDKRCLDSKATMTIYKSIKWDEYFLPVYGSFIEMPSNVILWRGYDTLYPALTNRSVYFGDKAIAQEYANTSPTHTVGSFATTKPLKLLDIRFLTVLLKDLLHGSTGNAVQKTTVAFGLCSFYHQLYLMQVLYKEAIAAKRDLGYKSMLSVYKQSEIEQPGVRVAETSNDGWVMAFLSEVFNNIVDGFIAPQLITPYQVHTNFILHPELILFNPVKSGIIQLDSVPQTVSVSVAELINQQFPSPITLRARGTKTEYVARGGNGDSNYIPAIEIFNDALNRGDTDALYQYNDAIGRGKELRKRVLFSDFDLDKQFINKELPDRSVIYRAKQKRRRKTHKTGHN